MNLKKIFFFFRLLFLVLSFFTPQTIFCQNSGFKYISNYTPKEYHKKPQNWWILQGKRGVIYVGNNNDLLEFDGVSWRDIDVTKRTVRSLSIDDTGTIYIGGNSEFGYLAPDSKGTLQYVSLLKYLKDNERDFQEIWKTYSTKEGIYFQAKEILFRWNQKKIKQWPPVSRFHFSYTCEGKFFILQEKVGLMQMVEDRLTKVPGGETFADKRIYMMVPYDPKKLLIGTRSDGFYIYDGKKAIPFHTEVDDYLIKKQLYHGIRLSSSSTSPGFFALATLRGGLVIIDSHGRLKEIFTKAHGLLDDDVKYVYEDFHGNLWLALNKGISKIEYSSPLSTFDERANLPGLVLSVVKHRNKLYAGTTQGLYFFVSPDSFISPGKFQSVPEMTSMCWSLLSIGDSLLAATDDGIFQVGTKNNIKPTVVENSSYVLHQSKKDKNHIWVGTNRGLLSLCMGNERGEWTKERKFEKITQEIRTIVEDEKGNLWLGTPGKGVLKVDFIGDGAITHPAIFQYHSTHGLPPGEVNVFWAAGHVMFATGEGIFRFDEKTKVFIPDSTLGNEFAGGPNGRGVFRIAEDRHKNIWFYSRSWNFQATPGLDGTYVINRTPFLRIPPAQVNTIYPDPEEDAIWFGGDEGLIRYDKTVKKNYQNDFSTLIRKVWINGKLVFDGWKIKYKKGDDSKPEYLFPIIDYKDRNLRFEFAAPFFESEAETRYQCFLEGYDDNWSSGSSEPQKEYTNLDSGMYTFQVRAENIYNNLSSEAIFQFKVLPPWYKTWWAFSLYAIVGFLLVVFIVKWRSSKLKREKQRLEKTVKERTTEINVKNQQLEKQTLQLKEQSGKLEEMDRMKSRFFANISHEFRTPLTLIMGPMEQMLSSSRDKEQKNQLNLMLRNSQRLLTLINQLLDLSRVDSGKMRLQAGRQNMIPFLKGILASFELLAVQRKIDLKFSADDDSEVEDIPLYFDPEKLEEVFCNLLSNAAKFTPPGGKITVIVKRILDKTKEGSYSPIPGFLEISVSDTGVGIPKEKLEHIFDRFYQVEGSTSDLRGHDYKGTGIGLALAKELVDLHHGRIDVHSSEGKGTEFIIRLPMGKEHLKPVEIVELPETPSGLKKPGKIPARYMTEEGENEEKPTEAYEDKKDIDKEQEAQEKNVILVVEDNADVRKYIRGPLEPFYTVVEAVNGREGIHMAKEIIPDLVISDIMMPEADGYELCRELKTDIKTSHVPIILLTAKASAESIIEGLEIGADDYITKPFNTKILIARIKNLIDLRQQLQQKIQRQLMLQPAEISVSSMDETFLKELQDTIEKNLSEPEFNVDQLGKKLYMSRASLYRKIQALTGEAPRDFIRSYRLKRGAQLLKANFGNVTEVAFEVGFSSTAYFTKCFKEKFHQLPHAYQLSESG
jgi:signal transduction histidine kinase/DNA-binding response OmpR family regulator